MAKAHASRIIEAPVETVWAIVRNFDGLPDWHPFIADSTIEDGRSADSVGCVRSIHTVEGTQVRERLLALSDAHWSFTYNFEKEAFPVDRYEATLALTPVTSGNRCFASWSATFDERPGSTTDHAAVITEGVFVTGLAALAKKAEAATPAEPGIVWRGGRPAKVFCSSVIDGPVDRVWAIMRDFAGMGGWHEAVSQMTMLDGRRSDEVGATRDFLFGEGRLHEQLLWLSDLERSFGYRITMSPMPWLNYVAWAELRPVTDGDRTLGIWQANWTAAPEDDLLLIPDIHANVFQKAFDTLEQRYCRTSGGA